MARKPKTCQISLDFFDQAIAAKLAALEKRLQAENAGEAEAQAGLRRAPRPQMAHGKGERRQGALPALP